MTSLPHHMRAVHFHQPGGPGVLTIVERPVPQPGADEVLIRVEAAGVNGHDLRHRQGTPHPIEPGESDLAGLEAAGEIVAVGANVKDWRVGDRVCALLRGGGYGEYCTAKAALCLPVPKGLDWVQAAALPETVFTVWTNIYTEAQLKPGEDILIHGGASGIGTTAIQLAHAFGSRVFTTVSSDERAAFCRSLGADVAINYRKEDFVAVVKEKTGGRGVNVVLDIVAGPYIMRDVEASAVNGRVLVIGTTLGRKVEIDCVSLIYKQLRLIGTGLRIRPTAYKAAVALELREKVWPLIDAGKIKPVVDSVFSFDDAAKAHARMEASQHIGKVMLRPRLD